MKGVAGKFEVTTFGLRERSYLSIFAEKRRKAHFFVETAKLRYATYRNLAASSDDNFRVADYPSGIASTATFRSFRSEHDRCSASLFSLID
jgi:hypothetical protein